MNFLFRLASFFSRISNSSGRSGISTSALLSSIFSSTFFGLSSSSSSTTIGLTIHWNLMVNSRKNIIFYHTSENCTCGPDSDIWSCQNIGRHRGSFTSQISTLSILLQMLPNFAWSFFYISTSHFFKKTVSLLPKFIVISDIILHCNFVW